MKWIDIPPVWLFGFGILTYLISTIDWLKGRSDVDDLMIEVPHFSLAWGGNILIGLGIVLMAAAIIEMGKHRTTVIPHRKADSLVQTGIFAFSRNPIYLGDVLVLAGWAMVLNTPVALLLVPVFVVILRRRFIEPEEDMLFETFGTAFDEYCEMTRRWF